MQRNLQAGNTGDVFDEPFPFGLRFGYSRFAQRLDAVIPEIV